MQNDNPRGISRNMRFTLAVLILAWATQLLLHQWGYGAQMNEVFVPAAVRPGAVLELRDEAQITGGQVTLRQIARWSSQDDAALAPLADLVVGRLEEKSPFMSLSLDQLKGLLSDAGVNLAMIRFAGPTRCTVSRTDLGFNETRALEQWAGVKSDEPATKPALPATSQAPADGSPSSATAPSGVAGTRTLRDLLLSDLAARLNLAAESLQVDFEQADKGILAMSDQLCVFSIEPHRLRGLGEVSWDVKMTAGQKAKTITVRAIARAWQNQAVLVKPVAARQVLRQEDVVARRTLSDTLADDPLITLEQSVGQQAARELKPGTILTARMVEAVPLARAGQLLTVLVRRGGVSVQTVARAMESGCYGQTIKARNESTNEIIDVTLSGPQTAEMGNSQVSSQLSVVNGQ